MRHELGAVLIIQKRKKGVNGESEFYRFLLLMWPLHRQALGQVTLKFLSSLFPHLKHEDIHLAIRSQLELYIRIVWRKNSKYTLPGFSWKIWLYLENSQVVLMYSLVWKLPHSIINDNFTILNGFRDRMMIVIKDFYLKNIPKIFLNIG